MGSMEQGVEGGGVRRGIGKRLGETGYGQQR